MWILPKQLHTLDSVQDTEALNLGLQESSQLCAQSLFVRSKHSPLRTWLQKWKRDSWSQHLYGRILKPSLGKAFETEWTSLLEVTHANHSPQQESEQERKTQDTCGLGSQTEFGFCDQECASLRMSKDISRWDSPASSATWKSWVTRCRGAYSARLKLARLTNASGYLSWLTVSTEDAGRSGSLEGWKEYETNKKTTQARLRNQIHNWPTATTRDWKGCGNAVQRKDGKHRLDTLEAVVMFGLPAPANPSADGSRQESWPTPASAGVTGGPCGLAGGSGNRASLAKMLPPQEAKDMGCGKLNPRWVETLMGLPIGWTMPSCTRPVIIAPMNCDCLGTELSQPPQNEHLELF